MNLNSLQLSMTQRKSAMPSSVVAAALTISVPSAISFAEGARVRISKYTTLIALSTSTF
ncbi:MAG: hypothetical protein ACI9G1_003221 [Pirellulaceae bacterium]|jgi:hypothetical protein